MPVAVPYTPPQSVAIVAPAAQRTPVPSAQGLLNSTKEAGTSAPKEKRWLGDQRYPANRQERRTGYLPKGTPLPQRLAFLQNTLHSCFCRPIEGR